MKKILITGLLILLALPCFASNSIQQENEKIYNLQIEKMLQAEDETILFNVLLINLDYYADPNNPDTLYNRMSKLKQELKNDYLNLSYINKWFELYLKIINSKSYILNDLQKFKKYRIIIPDKDYIKLNPEVLQMIMVINTGLE